MITAATSPLYVESKIADATGFSRQLLKRVRLEILEKKIEWSILGKQVVLTRPAADRVVAYLTADADPSVVSELDGQLAGCLLAHTPAKKKEGVVELTVIRCCGNTRLLSALDPGPPERAVTVRVTSNKNFRPRMTLQARAIGPNLYQLEGRCPRFPGRY